MSQMYYEFCIPTFHRPMNQKTLLLLEKLGWPKDHITISLQDKQDYQDYEKAGVFQRVGTILYRPGKCAADNRNTLLDHFPRGKQLVLLEDDINSIRKLVIDTQGKRKLEDIKSAEELITICQRGFAEASLKGTVAFGLNLYRNALFMKQGTHPRKICDTGFWGMKNTDLRFDNEMILLDDTDMCARIIKRYGAFISIEDAVAVHDRCVAGGCKELWSDGTTKSRMLKKLKARHGDIFNINPQKENSVTLKRHRGELR